MPRTKLTIPDLAEAAPGLWSNAIRTGDTLYISGQVARPFDGQGGMVGTDEYAQAKQIFSRIERIVKAAGGTMDNLVKMTIYSVLPDCLDDMRAARRKVMGETMRPAVTLVIVAGLATPEFLVEIEAWAAKA